MNRPLLGCGRLKKPEEPAVEEVEEAEKSQDEAAEQLAHEAAEFQRMRFYFRASAEEMLIEL